MVKRKLTDEVLEKVANEIKAMNKTKKEIMSDCNIKNKRSFSRAVRKAIKHPGKYLTNSQYHKWQDHIQENGFERRKAMHGLEYVLKQQSDAWGMGLGSDLERFRKISSKGGKAVQEKHPHVRRNLTINQYSSYAIYEYDRNKFSSKEERMVGANFLEFKVIDMIEFGKNYQVKVGKKKFDFLIEKNGEKYWVEYHPKGFRKQTLEEYITGRKNALAEANLPGKLKVLTKPIEVYYLLKDLGCDAGDYVNYLGVQRKIKEKIAKHESTAESAGLPQGSVKKYGKKSFYLIEQEHAIGPETLDIFGNIKHNHEVKKRIQKPHAIPIEKFLFLDIETSWGFSRQGPIFLIGTGRCDGDKFRIKGYFARNFMEEKGILAYFASQLKKYKIFVTFNGTSFDLPFIKDRAERKEIELRHEMQHIDLYHLYKKSKKIELPDYKLRTIEKLRLDHHRGEEEDSSQIGAIYHHYVRTKNAYRINKIIQRNFTDIYNTFRGLCDYIKTEHEEQKT
jgi:uncharacterized protein YprB with RNaseH-like and TPR domain